MTDDLVNAVSLLAWAGLLNSRDSNAARIAYKRIYRAVHFLKEAQADQAEKELWIEKAESELAQAQDVIVAAARDDETFTELVDQWSD